MKRVWLEFRYGDLDTAGVPIARTTDSDILHLAKADILRRAWERATAACRADPVFGMMRAVELARIEMALGTLLPSDKEGAR